MHHVIRIAYAQAVAAAAAAQSLHDYIGQAGQNDIGVDSRASHYLEELDSFRPRMTAVCRAALRNTLFF
ncbi:hypothetical protein RIEGSTA812A_PEG_1073 [invertebrate metagenome]|uniref:Uncharacterized protein n=1 Tax=invertebrate metagenome TaxID=1711999 RepID=A0A484H7L4_9ZZZZ